MKISWLVAAFLVLLSGGLFGAWPLLMNYSRLTGFLYPAAYCVAVIILLAPFALFGDKSSIHGADWKYVVLAGIAGAGGLIAFCYLAANTEKETFSILFIITLVIQASIPTLYLTFKTGKLPGFLLAGVVAASVAIVCLGVALIQMQNQLQASENQQIEDPVDFSTTF